MQSELGEPIHKIATRAIKLFPEFDETVFKLVKDKHQVWLNANADSVIDKLNRNFAKPWFAQKKDGTVVKDLGDLTYEEMVVRLVCLMYVKRQSRWIDISLRNLLGDRLRRVEERFTGVNSKPLSLLSPHSCQHIPGRVNNCLLLRIRNISSPSHVLGRSQCLSSPRWTLIEVWFKKAC